MFSVQHFIKQRGGVWVSCTYYAKNLREAVALINKHAMRGIASPDRGTEYTSGGRYQCVYRTDKREYMVLRNAKATAELDAISTY